MTTHDKIDISVFLMLAMCIVILLTCGCASTPQSLSLASKAYELGCLDNSRVSTDTCHKNAAAFSKKLGYAWKE